MLHKFFVCLFFIFLVTELWICLRVFPPSEKHSSSELALGQVYCKFHPHPDAKLIKNFHVHHLQILWVSRRPIRYQIGIPRIRSKGGHYIFDCECVAYMTKHPARIPRWQLAPKNKESVVIFGHYQKEPRLSQLECKDPCRDTCTNMSLYLCRYFYRKSGIFRHNSSGETFAQPAILNAQGLTK